MLLLTQKEIEQKLDIFIWSFKVGDNILHNYEGILFLYTLKATFNQENSDHAVKRRFLNKHISITIVSIIEAILYDFVTRLDSATNQFPKSIPLHKEREIKRYILSQKVPFKTAIGEHLRVKNYPFTQLLNLIKKFELLGDGNSTIYSALEKIGYFRNRIHIYNWFDNFEKDEKNVFTDKRLLALEDLFLYVLDHMSSNYSRS